MAGLGVPWYCDDCGQQVQSFMTFHPSEMMAAYYHFNSIAEYLRRYPDTMDSSSA